MPNPTIKDAGAVHAVEPGKLTYIRPQLSRSWRIADDSSNIAAVADATGSTITADEHGTPVLLTSEEQPATAGMFVVRMPGGRHVPMSRYTYLMLVGDDLEVSDGPQVRAPAGPWWTPTETRN